MLSLASPSATLWPNLSLLAGRAIIGLDDSAAAAPSPGLFIVDFRQLVDDVAGGTATLLGSLPLTGVRDTVVRGGWLYAAGSNSVLTVDIKETMAEPPVALPASPAGGSTPGSSDSIEVFGNHLFSIGRNGGSIKAVDVRAPASPVVMSVLPISSTYFFGSTTLEPYVAKPYHRGLVVRGTRLYETGYDEVRIIELE